MVDQISVRDATIFRDISRLFRIMSVGLKDLHDNQYMTKYDTEDHFIESYPGVWMYMYALTIVFTSPWCRLIASANRVSIGSDNGLSPFRRQVMLVYY